MRLLPLWLALALALGAGGCASQTLLTIEERSAIERDLTGPDADRFLRLSFYATPFFGDATKRLLTPVPPEEVRMLEYPDGTPVNPGGIEATFPMGTRVRIRKVEFPTSWAMTERVLYTPRAQPWVFVEAAGDADPRPLIVVLRPGIKTQGEFRSEVERFLLSRDPAPPAIGFSPIVRAAIREKRALLDMTAEALEMAWGYPEIKKRTYDNSVLREDWIYPGGGRVAHLADGRVVALDGGKR